MRDRAQMSSHRLFSKLRPWPPLTMHVAVPRFEARPGATLSTLNLATRADLMKLHYSSAVSYSVSQPRSSQPFVVYTRAAVHVGFLDTALLEGLQVVLVHRLARFRVAPLDRRECPQLPSAQRGRAVSVPSLCAGSRQPWGFCTWYTCAGSRAPTFLNESRSAKMNESSYAHSLLQT